MKILRADARIRRYASFLVVLVLFSYAHRLPAASARSASSSGSASDIQQYGTGTWDSDTLGNHRAVVRVSGSADAVWAHIEWRRRDKDPENKEIIIIDGKTGKRVQNVARINVTRECGDIVFQPVSGAGEYDVYFMPYEGNLKSNYPKISYLAPTATAEPEWLQRNHLRSSAEAFAFASKLRKVDSFRLESIDDFNRFTTMELTATSTEVKEFLAADQTSSYFVFPEDRSRSIRMTDFLPAEWMHRRRDFALQGTAGKGEFYVFQLGVWAARQNIQNLRVDFPSLVAADGRVVVPSNNFRCFNFGGIDAHGQSFTQAVNVPKGKIQPLWCGVQIPDDAVPGTISGQLVTTANRDENEKARLELTITGQAIRNHGDDDPSTMARLRWLDSTLAEDDNVIPPYTPIRVSGNELSILGRVIHLGQDGLPTSIESSFGIEMTSLADHSRAVLAAPIRLVLEDSEGKASAISPKRFAFTKSSPGVVKWESEGSLSGLEASISGQLEFDGSIDYTVAVKSAKALNVRDIRLEIPFAGNVARYAMGLGLQGAAAPPKYDWKWDVERNQDSAWIGDVNAGLQFSLRDNRYVRPLNTNFYHSQPLILPDSWANHGKGGCHLGVKEESTYEAVCYSGPRAFTAGETQFYNFRLLVTPFHTIQPEMQWKDRYFHAYKPVEEIAATGANTINIHHATAINPYINYPFLRAPEMKDYIQQAHDKNMKVKIYYTVRELTNHAPEIFALDSLDGEVIAKGPGGGPSWLQEHFPDHYIPGWYVPELKDAALVTTGSSRWLNFYVEGMRWLVENEHIDGLYLDDIAFDRATMERIRKVLLNGNPGGLIDVHSANQFNPRDGFASSANLYLEQFPFIDRLWFGEYFDYNSSPDYWLVEMSGIPFGLMGEMLQGGGNPWRGMLYGMTARAPWSGNPQPLWKFWDKYGIESTQMIGYWAHSSPVSTGSKKILATTYKAKDRAIVALASWDDNKADVRLSIDWKAFGMNPAEANIYAPAIENFQEERTFSPDEAIPVAPGRGWLLVIEKAPSTANGTTLEFEPIPAKRYPEHPFKVNAQSASQGAITYSVVSGPATISGNTVTLTGGGQVELAARQAGSASYPVLATRVRFVVNTPASEAMSFHKEGEAVSASPDADTPNYLFNDADGTFYLQNAYSQYDTAPEDHFWDFYTGKNALDPKLELSKAHSVYDTQKMCETGNPVYTAFYSVPGRKPGPKGFADGNFCDVMGVWVDPDTGDWYGIVHNELYPNAPRIDALSYAISKDKGVTWILQAPIATSPYGVGSDKEHYYYYGDGDPRLIVDTASGYFYFFYFSRIMSSSGGAFLDHTWEHVIRAPISKKMAPDSWEKYYHGTWSQTKGIDWICDPTVSSCGTGAVAASMESNVGADGDPVIQQEMIQPIAKQTVGDLNTYGISGLTNTNVSWSVYLQKYIAEVIDKNAQQIQFYVSDDLAKQKWTYAGSVPYQNDAAWYWWMVDAGNLSSVNNLGKTFLAYCTISCSAYESEYVPITVDLNAGTVPPNYYSAVNGKSSRTHTFVVQHQGERPASSSRNDKWTFTPAGDGYFYLEQEGMRLQVGDGDRGRAWGAQVSLAAPMSWSATAPELSRQQWRFERVKATDEAAPTTPQYRLVNRYSGLALSFPGKNLTSANLADAVTVPIRDWDPPSTAKYRAWRVTDQQFVFIAR